ncbi:hypothetical protein HYP85_gp021 [Pseudomonas phage Zuri]|uniref:Uncharacterized protein n=1 Tax=Pseudomonas phage Zuri TaxID=2604899 RepID=A0A5C1K5M5_9CAUD|nr:hypothetical protein HYP85_gp021 [Pseudomonas phage Zuri]QEM41118.1 hypothetical protein Zuri_21 [Pseudomonas phage Zuri]
MFVSSKKHNALLADYEALKYEHKRLVKNWNEIVAVINAKGGQAFLDGEVTNSEFSQEEIKTLIQLCHPDKHAGKESAVRLTQKLLTLRK